MKLRFVKNNFNQQQTFAIPSSALGSPGVYGPIICGGEGGCGGGSGGAGGAGGSTYTPHAIFWVDDLITPWKCNEHPCQEPMETLLQTKELGNMYERLALRIKRGTS